MKSPTGALIHIFPTLDALAEAAACELIARAAPPAAAGTGFNLGLSGGSTPRPLYRLLGSPLYGHAIPWAAVKVFFADERCVPPGHPDSNYGMIRREWLEESPIPPGQVFRMEGEDPEPHAAAERYSRTLTRELPAGPTGFPALDLLLLGMGPDGHTASLFPKTAALDETLRVVAANAVPQLGATRLTLTYPTLDAAREVWFLVTGADKARLVAACLGYAPGGEDYPAALVRPLGGNLHWWLDSAAASALQ